MLHRHLDVGPDTCGFTLTRACEIEMYALRKLFEHVPTQVITHNPLRMIEISAHATCHRCSACVLAGKEYHV